jgi:transcriptional regulator with XRE-family HTH domain
MQLRIKQMRVAMGLSGKDFAHKLGISAAYLSQLEKGVRTCPSAELLSSMANILCCTVGELTENAVSITPPQDLRCAVHAPATTTSHTAADRDLAREVADLKATLATLTGQVQSLTGQVQTLTTLLGATLTHAKDG